MFRTQGNGLFLFVKIRRKNGITFVHLRRRFRENVNIINITLLYELFKVKSLLANTNPGSSNQSHGSMAHYLYALIDRKFVLFLFFNREEFTSPFGKNHIPFALLPFVSGTNPCWMQ